jgi:hypothetical protein
LAMSRDEKKHKREKRKWNKRQDCLLIIWQRSPLTLNTV